MKTIYKSGELIFGLREEYLSIENELLKLKKLVRVNDSNELKRFLLNDDNKVNFEYIKKYKNILGRLYNLILNITNPNKVKVGSVYIKNNEFKLLDEDMINILKLVDETTFRRQLRNILSSDFYKRMKLDFTNKKEGFNLSTDYSGITLTFKQYIIKYISYLDRLSIMGSNSLNDDILKELLNYDIDIKDIGKYHIELLNKVKQRKIMLASQFRGSAKEDLNIFLKDDEIILKKIN